MIPWETLGRARAPDGVELILQKRGDEHVIRAGGKDLMSSRMHGSEEKMADLACAGLAAGARVLIGGLGMGYTLAAALRILPAGARVLVAELVAAVVDWNRGPLADLAGRPLDDARATVEVGDVAAVLRRAGFTVDVVTTPARGPAGGSKHTIFLGRP